MFKSLSEFIRKLISTFRGLSHVDDEISNLIKEQQGTNTTHTNEILSKTKDSLIKYQPYDRKEVHDILDPDANYTKGNGHWGMHGIINIKRTKGDHVFFVTFGQSQGDHTFKEKVTQNGILSWQSQPRQNLDTPLIKKFISHSPINNNIYLFLRTKKNMKYTYLGLLDYVSHDNNKENPVWFQWQILDWNIDNTILIEMDLELALEKNSQNTSASLNFSSNDTVRESTLDEEILNEPNNKKLDKVTLHVDDSGGLRQFSNEKTRQQIIRAIVKQRNQ